MSKVSAFKVVEAAPRYLGVPYSTLDCQAFVEKCLKDAGAPKDLAGSNAWYRFLKNGHGWVGTPDECRKKFGTIPVGSFLFILKQDGGEPEKYKSDGIGNASHIGLYTGMTGKQMVDKAVDIQGSGMRAKLQKLNYGDGAIHSSSSRGCVCTSKFKGNEIRGGWNRIGLWLERIDYDVSGKETGGESTMENYKAKVVDGNLNLRMMPSVTSAKITLIPDGSIVNVTGVNGDWSAVEWSGMSGYVMSRYLEKIQETGNNGNTNNPNSPFVSVPRAVLENMYDVIGDWLGFRG